MKRAASTRVGRRDTVRAQTGGGCSGLEACDRRRHALAPPIPLPLISPATVTVPIRAPTSAPAALAAIITVMLAVPAGWRARASTVVVASNGAPASTTPPTSTIVWDIKHHTVPVIRSVVAVLEPTGRFEVTSPAKPISVRSPATTATTTTAATATTRLRTSHDIVGPRSVVASYRLREVDPYPPVVDQYVLHLEVSLLGVLTLVKLYERVLERITGLFVADDLATHDDSKPREDELEVFVCCDWVEFAYE